MGTIENDLNVLCEQGQFRRPIAPHTFPLLAENIWSLWLNWLRMQQISTPGAALPDDTALYDCALHNWSLCQPWMSSTFACDLLTIFDELLKPDKKSYTARQRIARPPQSAADGVQSAALPDRSPETLLLRTERYRGRAGNRCMHDRLGRTHVDGKRIVVVNDQHFRWII